MADDKASEIRVSKGVVSNLGIFDKYATGKPRETQPVATVASEDKPRRKRKIIRLEQIVEISPVQPGQRYFDPSLPEDLELAASIKETGLQDPLIVKELPIAGVLFTYRLVGGHRRQGALIYNANQDGIPWQGVKVEVALLNPDEDEIVVALHENFGHKPLTAPQRGELFWKLKEERHLSISQIRERLHVREDPKYMERLIMAWDSPDPVRSLFCRGLSINHTLDLRGVWNKLPESWRNANSEAVTRLSSIGANKFIEKIKKGAPADSALAEAQAEVSSDDVPFEAQSLPQVGQGAAVAESHPAPSPSKRATSPKEDHSLLEPMFSKIGLTDANIKELKRAGGSDSFEEVTLAALSVRRGMDTDQSLTFARALTHSRSLRHVAHRLVLDISKVLTKSVKAPEYQFLKYILYFSDEKPSAEVDEKPDAKKRKPRMEKGKKKKKGKAR
jgi:hypothetical protein